MTEFLRRVKALFDKDLILSPGISLRAALAEYVTTLLFIVIATGAASGLSFSTNASGNAGDSAGIQAASVAAVTLSTAMAFGFSIVALLYASGHSSGGQMNPAVVLGFLCAGRMPLAQATINIISQVLGAITGSAIVRGITQRSGTDGTLAGNSVPADITAGGAFLGEMIGTFALVFVVLETVVNHASLAGTSAPLAIGFTVFVSHLLLIPFTSCSINPARSLGPAIVSGNFGNRFWVFMIGPMVGAALASVVHLFFATDIDTVSDKAAEVVIPSKAERTPSESMRSRNAGDSARPSDVNGYIV